MSALQMSMNVLSLACVCAVCVLTLLAPSPVPSVRLDTLSLTTDRGVRVSHDPVTYTLKPTFVLRLAMLRW